MNRIFVTLGILPLHHAVWLFPAATALHFLEEAPGFTKWARQFASLHFITLGQDPRDRPGIY